MKVVRKEATHKLRFSDLNVGTVFTTPHTRDPNVVFMKINKDLSVNAINLEHSNNTSIGLHEEVSIIYGQFVENGADLP